MKKVKKLPIQNHRKFDGLWRIWIDFFLIWSFWRRKQITFINAWGISNPNKIYCLIGSSLGDTTQTAAIQTGPRWKRWLRRTWVLTKPRWNKSTILYLSYWLKCHMLVKPLEWNQTNFNKKYALNYLICLYILSS